MNEEQNLLIQFDYEPIILTDELLEKYQLKIDETKIEKFEDINFISF